MIEFHLILQTIWKNGDKVFLTQGTSKKARGTIHCMDPLAKCGCDYIGKECVSIQVTQSIEDTCALPFPTIEANTMSSAAGSIIRWPILSFLADNEGLHDHFEHATQWTDASFMRDSWQRRRVHLWNEAKIQKVGEGVILLVHHMKPSTSLSWARHILVSFLKNP